MLQLSTEFAHPSSAHNLREAKMPSTHETRSTAEKRTKRVAAAEKVALENQNNNNIEDDNFYHFTSKNQKNSKASHSYHRFSTLIFDKEDIESSSKNFQKDSDARPFTKELRSRFPKDSVEFDLVKFQQNKYAEVQQTRYNCKNKGITFVFAQETENIKKTQLSALPVAHHDRQKRLTFKAVQKAKSTYNFLHSQEDLTVHSTNENEKAGLQGYSRVQVHDKMKQKQQPMSPQISTPHQIPAKQILPQQVAPQQMPSKQMPPQQFALPIIYPSQSLQAPSVASSTNIVVPPNTQIGTHVQAVPTLISPHIKSVVNGSAGGVTQPIIISPQADATSTPPYQTATLQPQVALGTVKFQSGQTMIGTNLASPVMHNVLTTPVIVAQDATTTLTPTSTPTTTITPTPTIAPPPPSTTALAENKEDAKGFCFHDCWCWPVWAASTIIIVIYLVATFIAFYMNASLFSKGLSSKTFYKGGGYWIIGLGCVGLVTGCLVGGLVTLCVSGALNLGAGMMALSCSIVLVGRRGAWLGALGGLATGAAIGMMANLHALGVALGLAIGLMLGIIVGFFPFARDLKMNERYIRRGFRANESSARNASMISTQETLLGPEGGFLSENEGFMRIPSILEPRKLSIDSNIKDPRRPARRVFQAERRRSSVSAPFRSPRFSTDGITGEIDGAASPTYASDSAGEEDRRRGSPTAVPKNRSGGAATEARDTASAGESSWTGGVRGSVVGESRREK